LKFALFRSLFVLQLQIAFAEGAGGFIPLKMFAKSRDFRPGIRRFNANTTVVFSPRGIASSSIPSGKMP
jgi:hypothetical protein